MPRLLTETARVVDDQVAAAQARGRVPTLTAAVVRGGALAHTACAGQPVGPDTQLRIGSITKTFTAAMVLQLRDDGLLSLDDLLYRHLPGTAVGTVTLRQLLGHIGGLQREPDGQWWERTAGQPLDALLAAVTPEKLAHPPQHGFHYSNLAYGLLGAVLHRVTGESWPALLDQRLRQPIGLLRTTYHPQQPFAPGYMVHPWHGTLREEPRHDSQAMAPAGQLWSTLEDLGRWAGFLADPSPAVLAPATLAEMCAPVVICDPERWTAGHGLGLALWRDGERVYVGHTGSMPGYLAGLAVHRPSGTGVVALANAYTLQGSNLGQLVTGLLTAVLDREPPPPPAWRPAPEPPPELARLCGSWWWMGREYRAGWDTEAEELVLAPPAGADAPGFPGPRATPAWRFTRVGGDRWRGTAGMNDGELLLVERDPDGEVAGLEIATWRFTRHP